MRAMDREEEAPTELGVQRPPQFLEISGKDRLTLRYIGSASHGLRDVGSIQANRPVPRSRSLYYFEVQVLSAGEHGKIGIGFSDANFRAGYQPG